MSTSAILVRDLSDGSLIETIEVEAMEDILKAIDEALKRFNPSTEYISVVYNYIEEE